MMRTIIFICLLAFGSEAQVEITVGGQVVDPTIQHTVSIFDEPQDIIGFRNVSQDTVKWRLGQCRLNDDPNIDPSFLVYSNDTDWLNEVGISYGGIVTFPCWDMSDVGGLNMELTPGEGVLLRKGFNYTVEGCEAFLIKLIQDSSYIDSIEINYCGGFANLNELEDQEVFMYPNPAQDKIAVRSEAQEVQIFDLWGKKVIQVEMLVANEEISITELSNGVYIVQLQTSDGDLVRQSLVVQK